MILLLLLEFVLLLVALFFAVQFYNILFRGFAPFISSGEEVIEKTIAELNVRPRQEVYELGCGRASFLREVEKKFPEAKLTGVEYSFWPWLTTRVQISLRKSRIKIIKKNLFKVSLEAADFIYCYLNPKMMHRLEEKFMKECKSGVTIISYAFPIKDWTAVETLDLGKKGKVYFYKM